MKVVVATTNRGKLEELQALLPRAIELFNLEDVGLDAPVETGSTFLENARIKAHAVANAGYVALADDSGLEVDALRGMPGVRSARYAGENATDNDNNRKLVDELTGIPNDRRTARFRSVVVLADPSGEEVSACGTVEGRIINTPRGENGFGYDPLFEINDEGARAFKGMTMGELELEEKNRLSHRSRAYRALLVELDRSDNLGRNFRHFVMNIGEGHTA